MEASGPRDDANREPARADAPRPSAVLTWRRLAPGTGDVHARFDPATGALLPTRLTRLRRPVVVDQRAIVRWRRPRHGVDLVVERPLLWPSIVLPLLDLRHFRGTPTPEELESLAAVLEERRPRLWRESVASLREQAEHVRRDGDLDRSPLLDGLGSSWLVDVLHAWQ